ncbi:hypothetical protein Tco_0576829 [Tanacetum coccineum]
MAVNNLYQPYKAILSMINQCLTGKTSRFDRPRYPVLQMLWGIITSTNVDYAELIWEEFIQAMQTFLVDKANMSIPPQKGKKTKPHVIPYFQFTKGWKENISNKTEKSKKPATAKQLKLKPAKEKSTKPAPAKKSKAAQKKPSQPSPLKNVRKGKVPKKVLKEKGPLKLVDEEEEVQYEPVPKLQGEGIVVCNTKFAKPSILGKPVGQPLKNQSVVRQPTAFKSERPKISKERFASQVDVSNDLSKPVTTHYLPKRRESAPAKPHHMIAPSSSRYSSNDIVHNHYLEEAKKKTHEHSRIPRNFSDSKHFVCSTCQKCVFNANHDACVIKFLKEVNSRAKVPSNKTTNRNKPVEQIRVATKPKRQIPKGHRFSIKKTTTVHEKTTSPRSCLRWQPTGRILKTVCLRWVPTGKTFASSTTKVESEPPNGSNADIPNQCESEQALNVSAADQASVFMAMMSVHISSGLVLHQMTSDHNRSELGIQDHSNEQSSSKLVPKVVP